MIVAYLARAGKACRSEDTHCLRHVMEGKEMKDKSYEEIVEAVKESTLLELLRNKENTLRGSEYKSRHQKFTGSHEAVTSIRVHHPHPGLC
jgi:hypothetical protein